MLFSFLVSLAHIGDNKYNYNPVLPHNLLLIKFRRYQCELRTCIFSTSHEEIRNGIAIELQFKFLRTYSKPW